jgi:alpha-tubulin suppressor-like RCC1 family protein
LTGVLGNGETSLYSDLFPVKVLDVSNAKAVYAGDNFSFAKTANGVKAWGSNRWGQLGVGDKIDRLIAHSVNSILNASVKLAPGGSCCYALLVRIDLHSSHVA